MVKTVKHFCMFILVVCASVYVCASSGGYVLRSFDVGPTSNQCLMDIYINEVWVKRFSSDEVFSEKDLSRFFNPGENRVRVSFHPLSADSIKNGHGITLFQNSRPVVRYECPPSKELVPIIHDYIVMKSKE